MYAKGARRTRGKIRSLTYWPPLLLNLQKLSSLDQGGSLLPLSCLLQEIPWRRIYLVTSADETISMGSIDSDLELSQRISITQHTQHMHTRASACKGRTAYITHIPLHVCSPVC